MYPTNSFYVLIGLKTNPNMKRLFIWELCPINGEYHKIYLKIQPVVPEKPKKNSIKLIY